MAQRIIAVIGLIVGMLGVQQTAYAQGFGTAARHAVLLDATAGQVLFEKDADTPFPPASMSKLMTLYVAFDAIRNNELRLEDPVVVSDQAWRDWNNRGSTMFLRAGDTVTVQDLLRGIIVLSGNDACVVLAEHMAGTRDLFVDWMNAAAQRIGMTGSVFKNANGWPAEGHVMTARDLATLALKLTTEFPDLYPMFSEREFLYKDFKSNRYNRNPLLGQFPGADGLKTGHTEESGYGLTASAERDGRRLVLVLGGLTSISERRRESARMLQYGYRNFKTYPLFRAGEVVTTADTWLGETPIVEMSLDRDLRLTLSRAQRAQMTVSVQHINPIPAPIVAGSEVGTLTVNMPGRDPLQFPLIAKNGIDEIGGFGRLGAAFEYYVFGSTAQN